MKVLIVDDSATQRVILKAIANNHHSVSEVYEATDGLKALDIIESTQLDLIISDINMEPMSGLELITKVREAGKGIRFAFMSSHLTDSMQEQAKEAGGEFYITKPITQEKVEEVLEKVHSQNA